MDKKLIPTQDALEEYPILVQRSPNREGCFLFFNNTKDKGLNILRKKPEELITRGLQEVAPLNLGDIV